MDSVIHFELPVRDMDRAKEFYASLFGWSIDTSDQQYYMATTTPSDSEGMPKQPGAINGGFYKKTNPRDVPILVIRVKDIAATIQQIPKHGGVVVQPKTKVYDTLYYAQFKDSEGNIVGLVEPVSETKTVER